MTRTWNAIVRIIERGTRYGLLAVFGEGLRRRDPGAVINGVVALGATFFPDFVEARYDVTFRPWQRVYAGIAMLAHAVGMLGPYDETWWWDHVTHILSATLLSGFVHTAARRRGRDPAPRVLGAIVSGGVVWEILEYAIHALSRRLGIEPVLVTYGARDTLLDLVFDLIGALLVVAFGDRFLGDVTRRDD